MVSESVLPETECCAEAEDWSLSCRLEALSSGRCGTFLEDDNTGTVLSSLSEDIEVNGLRGVEIG